MLVIYETWFFIDQAKQDRACSISSMLGSEAAAGLLGLLYVHQPRVRDGVVLIPGLEGQAIYSVWCQVVSAKEFAVKEGFSICWHISQITTKSLPYLLSWTVT